MATASGHLPVRPASKIWNVVLWLIQVSLAVVFVGAGIWKLATPIVLLAESMPWMGQVAPGFLYLTAMVDVLLGLGVLLPSLVRIEPALAVTMAYACAAFMACAIVFHVFRGEAESTPINFLLFGLALLVAWGRTSKAPLPVRVRRTSAQG